MIDKVEFRNFKALREVSLDLERLTVLVGPNASGKTSVLEGLYLFWALEADPAAVKRFWDPHGLRSLTSRGAAKPPSLRCLVSHGGLSLDWFIHTPTIAPGNDKQDKEVVICSDGGHSSDRALTDPSTGLPDYGPAAFVRLDLNRLVAPAYSAEPVPNMRPNGEGLAAVLAYMAAHQREVYEAIETALRTVVPSVRSVRTPRAKVVVPVSEFIEVDKKTFARREDREYWGNAIEFDMLGAADIPASQASEGTMLVLGLLTVLMGPERPRLVLLDDIDRALHPKAQEDLVGLLRKMLEHNPDMQLVATSHSPYLLDHLKPEEVRLTTLKDDGSVAVGRLDRHPDFEKWKEEMTPGEFWSMVGERWVAEAGARE